MDIIKSIETIRDMEKGIIDSIKDRFFFSIKSNRLEGSVFTTVSATTLKKDMHIVFKLNNGEYKFTEKIDGDDFVSMDALKALCHKISKEIAEKLIDEYLREMRLNYE